MHGIIIMGHMGGPSVHHEDRIYDMNSDGTTWTITVRQAGRPVFGNCPEGGTA